MWADRKPDEFAQMKEAYPIVRTVRGWHAKGKDEKNRFDAVIWQ